MADFFGLDLVWLVVKMMVNHQRDGWTWHVIAYSPTVGWQPADSQIVCSDAEEMPVKDLIFFKYQTVFLSLLRPVLCAFERQPIKNPEVAIWYTVHVHPAALQLSTLDTACSTPMDPSLPPRQCPALCSHTFLSTRRFLCILCRRQLSERLQSKCFMVNSRTFPLSLFFFSKACKNEPSSGSI